jgi:hypothetical protein
MENNRLNVDIKDVDVIIDAYTPEIEMNGNAVSNIMGILQLHLTLHGRGCGLYPPVLLRGAGYDRAYIPYYFNRLLRVIEDKINESIVVIIGAY